LLAPYGLALEIIKGALTVAVSDMENHWGRFSAACVAQCENLHGQGSFTALVTPSSLSLASEIGQALVAQRDESEAIFTGLTRELHLPPSVDRTIFRLHMPVALNWSRF
jgi:hypothetical protein